MLKLVFVAVIAANGVLMATAKCKDRCGKDEVWEECPDSQCYPLTCSEVGFPIDCPSDSSECNCRGDPRCICKDGKVRDDKGKCINPEDCPECGGDPNAVLVPCSNVCPEGMSCAAVVCTPNTCRCREGYEYDQHKDKCVPIEDCTTVCGPNEVYSSCANGGCGKWNCTQIGQPDLCIDPLHCEGGCICKKGYLRARNGTCVPEDQCYYDVCPKNQIYDLCPASCPSRTCGVDDRLVRCARPLPVGDPNCPPPKCRCQDGFFRNYKGNCVPWDQCPQNKCTKPNEEYQQCPSCNPGTCDSIGKEYFCPLRPCKQTDPGECRCKAGFYRNKAGDCVTEKQCAKERCTKPNEVYQQCVEDCSPGTCESIGKSYSCPAKPNCKGQCRCKPGYFWNKRGECITKEQCLKCSGPNEYYSCGGACDNVCSNLSTQNQTHCPIINVKCNEMCYCDAGYARDDCGKCIPIDQCPQNKCTKPNEEYQQCPSCNPGTCDSIGKEYHCPLRPCKQTDPGECRCKAGFYRNKAGDCVTEKQCAKERCTKPNEVYQQCVEDCSPGTCESIGKSYSCPAKPNCKGQCRCKPGYFWNKRGECITKEQCLKCSGPNEYYSCGGACDNVCSNLSTQNQTHCPIINVKCNEMCYCDEGYARDACGKCIPIDQCPQNKCTKPNEEYQQCPSCNPGTCDSIGKEYHCPLRTCNQTDPGECRCKAGFYRNKAGDCVTEKQCAKERCTKPNEVYQQCVEDCSPGTCESIGKSYSCPAKPNCKGQCRCKPGYFWNKRGECITKAQCLKCSGPNEYYSCGGACDNVCSKLSTQNQTHCPIINIKCNEMCYCDEGYARDDCGKCIPIDQCQESCGGDPNAKPGCGSNCGRTCSTYKIADRILCAAVCKENGCDCKEGYVLDDKTGKCVLPDQCPPETDESCGCGGDPNAKPGCGVNCGRTCSTYKIADRISCAAVCKENGCDCKEGYVLDENLGKCVLPDQCPAEPEESCGGDPNAKPGCGVNCGRLCSNYKNASQVACPDICKVDGCDCKEGYVLDENTGKCVLPEQCSSCKENERYVECPEAECVPLTCADAGFPVACPRIADGRCPSKPACICNSGYLRNSKGICVPQNECPSCRGDPNARPGCGVNCGKLCSNYQNSDGVACPAICNLNGCDCIDGYVLDTNTGKCVLPEQCTSPCGPNQVYSDCVNGECNKRNCSQINDPDICIDPVKCEGGCVCQDGYLRDEDGTCVPEDQCKGKCPEGEIFSDCPPVYKKDCNSELCPRSRDDPAVCPTTRQCGKPRCICSNLRKRNRKTGKCVLASECPPFPCNGKNEVYDSCPPSCPGENCSDYLNNSTCPKTKIGIVVPCKPACRCKKNTYRNSKGVCVSGDECKCESS